MICIPFSSRSLCLRSLLDNYEEKSKMLLFSKKQFIEEPRHEVIKWSLCCYKRHFLQESTGGGKQSPTNQGGRLWGLGLELTLEG